MNSQPRQRVLPIVLGAAIAAMPLVLVACDQSESKSKTTSVRSTETPDGGVKTTKETTEKKVETSPK